MVINTFQKYYDTFKKEIELQTNYSDTTWIKEMIYAVDNVQREG